MRLMLAALLVLLFAQDGFGYAVGFGSLLSAKNLLIVGALILLMSRALRAGQVPLELPVIQFCFVIMIGYATLTWFIASFIIEYERYPIWQNGGYIKQLLVDRFLLFLAFFYGPRNRSDVLWGLAWLLGLVGLSHALTVGAWVGFVPDAVVSFDKSGRLGGLIVEEPNQYALLTVALLPALVAMAVAHGRAMRLAWSVSAILAVGCLVLMASRGAFVAALVAAAAGIYLFRRQISATAVVRLGFISVGVLVVFGILVGASQYGEVLMDRIFEDTLNEAGMRGMSKGRTDLWLAAFEKMAEAPVTFVTGYGWRAYFSLPHVLAPHSTYVDAWFNLGLPGLLCLVGIFWSGASVVQRAVSRADRLSRPHLIAATIGIIAAAVGLFFVEWYQPWMYFWAYFGLTLRMAVVSRVEEVSARSASSDQESSESSATSSDGRDPFGWVVGNK